MTKTVKKVVAGISALVILGGAAVGAWAVMENSRSSYPSFDQIEADKEYTTDLGEGVTNEGGAEISETVENGVQLMSAKIEPKDFAANGISPMAETAYTITAKVKGSDGSLGSVPQVVSFSSKFVNPSSAWANGKSVTNYVTVTPTSDSSAVVECLKGFSEQIIVTATSVYAPSYSATCTVDYVKRATSVKLVSGQLDFNGSNRDTELVVEVEYTEGTLDSIVEITGYEFAANSGLVSAVEDSRYYSMFESVCESEGYDAAFNLDYSTLLTDGYFVEVADDDVLNGSRFAYKADDMYVDSNVSSASSGQIVTGRLYFWYALLDAMDDSEDDVAVNLTWQCRYNGKVYASGTTDGDYLDVKFGFSLPTVSGVELTPDLIF